MKTRRALFNWLTAAGMAAALFAALMLVSNFRYENSDDGLIVRAFMGFEGGEPANFSLYVHTLLAWGLWALGKAVPGVPWFSAFQLGLLVFSCAVLARAFLALASGYRRAALVGGAGAVLYLLVFAAFACCRINYMTTAALAGAAAVAQCLATPLRGKGSALGHALWLLLFGCAFCLRSQGALPSAAFLGLALVWKLAAADGAQAEARATRRAALYALLALAGIIALLLGVRQAELAVRGLSADVDWHAARTQLMDYTRFEIAPQPGASMAGGLPAPLADMVARWYFLDSRITAEAMRAMAAAYAGEGATFWAGWQTLLADTRVLLSVLLIALLSALCLAAGRGGARLARAAAVLALLGAAAMLSYLALTGRAPARAADAVLMPCAALLCGLLLTLRVNPLAGHAPRRAVLALLCAALLATAGASVWVTRRAITRAQDVQGMERARLFTQIGLAHPDWYVLRSPNLFRDTGLSPYAAEGVPANTAVWGDWTCRTPSWYAQLAALGLDGHTFAAADWLREGIVLVSVDEAERAALCAYLGDAAGGTVEAVQVGENGGLPYYRFVRAGGALK